jgi:hypothetical protein
MRVLILIEKKQQTKKNKKNVGLDRMRSNAAAA